jgi:tetratricopeptide (TPR) repeat protein
MMSFFGRLFGSVKSADEKKRADALFEQKHFFEAKTAYESAAGAGDATDGVKKECGKQVRACLDGLARERMAEAEGHLARGDLALGRTELLNAMEVAATDAVKHEAQRRLERAERDDARTATPVDDDGPTDEDRYALLAAVWEEAQQEEYDEYGEPFRDALIAMDKGEAKEALATLEPLARGNEDAVYLWLEVARARRALDDYEGTGKALRMFVKRVPDEDRSEPRVAAYVALAQLAEVKPKDEAAELALLPEGEREAAAAKRASEREEKAIKQLQKGLEAMPDDPRPYLNLGMFLRERKHPEEAIELIDLAIDLMDEDRPSWLAYQELGLAHRDAGNDDKAVDLLEKVVRHFVQRSVVDFPASAALPLAALYEKRSSYARAADLYASLARGTDRKNHIVYHRAAARVLLKIDQEDEARRMLTRAAALAEGDEALTTEIEKDIAALDER